MEDNDMMKYPVEKQVELAKQMEKLGMEMGVFTSPVGGGYKLTGIQGKRKGEAEQEGRHRIRKGRC